MSFNRVLILGASGMLGQAFTKQLQKQKISYLGASRNHKDFKVDFSQEGSARRIIIESKADLVINCAALVSLKECEDNPLLAIKINSILVKEISKTCFKYGKKFIQISTDHYYLNDGRRLHKESDKVELVNQYAISKKLGEDFALEDPNSLIIRTNVTGVRGIKEKPTFFEWVFGSLKEKKPLNLFTDFYTSTISSDLCAEYSLMACKKGITGVLNIASKKCISKKEFVVSLSKEMGINLDWAKDSSIKDLKPKRADSLGLDCSLAEAKLGIIMPSSKRVALNLLASLRGN